MYVFGLTEAEREELCDEWSVIRRSNETETDDVEVVRYYEYRNVNEAETEPVGVI